MNKQEKKGLVPVLRFSEFRGEWEENTLEEVSKYRRGSFPQPYGLPEWYDNENGMPFIQVVDVGDDMKLKPITKRRISDLACDQSVFIEKGTVIITIQGSIGRVAVTQYDAYIDRTLLLFQGFLKPIDKYFFSYILQNLFEIEKQKAPGEIIKTITKEALSSFIVKLPLIKEQQKIADCLSSIDKILTAQNQKLEALKSHKKGLMQQLFPTEGKTVPKLRFPEFQGQGVWIEQKVSNLLVKVSNPVTVDRKQNYRQIGIRSHGKGIFHKESVVGREIGNKRVFWVEEDAFIVNIVFAWELAIAITTSAENGMIASHRFPMYKPKNNKSNTRYMKYFFLTHKGKELLWIASPGGAGRNKTLGQKDFENLELLAPRVEEQEKIADCLSSVDELITAQSQKIESIKAHKKGLMQQLFPTVDEVDV